MSVQQDQDIRRAPARAVIPICPSRSRAVRAAVLLLSWAFPLALVAAAPASAHASGTGFHTAMSQDCTGQSPAVHRGWSGCHNHSRAVAATGRA